MADQLQPDLTLRRLMAEYGFTREGLAEAVNGAAEQLTGTLLRGILRSRQEKAPPDFISGMTSRTETMRNHWWWRPGWSVGRRFHTWHLTFEGETDVHRLAAEYRSALAPLGDVLTPVPDRWLHLTMQGIGFVGEAKEEDAQAIADAARDRLATVPAFDLRIGPALLDSEAVLLHVEPDGPVRAVRDAIGDVLGDVPERAEGFTPHVSVAYSNSEGPAGPIAQALADLDIMPARARISAVELIVINRDDKMYEWESFAKARLGWLRAGHVIKPRRPHEARMKRAEGRGCSASIRPQALARLGEG